MKIRNVLEYQKEKDLLASARETEEDLPSTVKLFQNQWNDTKCYRNKYQEKNSRRDLPIQMLSAPFQSFSACRQRQKGFLHAWFFLRNRLLTVYRLTFASFKVFLNSALISYSHFLGFCRLYQYSSFLSRSDFFYGHKGEVCLRR